MTEAYLFDALRTPRGKGKPTGSLHEVKPIDLVVGLLHEVKRRIPAFEADRVEDVILGCVAPVGEQGADIAKIAALAAGYPHSVSGVQVNRFCASGLEAVNQAAHRVRSGWENVILAGGVESMSRVPMGSDGGAWALDPATALTVDYVPQGISADLIATMNGWDRAAVDSFAVESHARAAQATQAGYFDRSLVPVEDLNGMTLLDHDELVRPGTSLESLSGLRPSFEALGEAGFDAVALEKYLTVEYMAHVHHAGNSSGIVDGAALVVVGSEKLGEELGITPRARIVSMAVAGSDPTLMLAGPAPAARKALDRAGLAPDDIDLYEMNEAFAAAVMLFMKDLDVPHEKVNVNGGAIALGHPLGATGAMLVGTLMDELERRELRYGLATLCVGAGMGIATIIERI